MRWVEPPNFGSCCEVSKRMCTCMWCKAWSPNILFESLRNPWNKYQHVISTPCSRTTHYECLNVKKHLTNTTRNVNETAFAPETFYSKYPLYCKQLLHQTPLTTNNLDATSLLHRSIFESNRVVWYVNVCSYGWTCMSHRYIHKWNVNSSFFLCKDIEMQASIFLCTFLLS